MEHTIGMNLRLPNSLNEALLDKVAIERKRGNRTTKENLIINMIKEHRKELL
jgi:hypothetical protein